VTASGQSQQSTGDPQPPQGLAGRFICLRLAAERSSAFCAGHLGIYPRDPQPQVVIWLKADG